MHRSFVTQRYYDDNGCRRIGGAALSDRQRARSLQTSASKTSFLQTIASTSLTTVARAAPSNSLPVNGNDAVVRKHGLEMTRLRGGIDPIVWKRQRDSSKQLRQRQRGRRPWSRQPFHRYGVSSRFGLSRTLRFKVVLLCRLRPSQGPETALGDPSVGVSAVIAGQSDLVPTERELR